MPDPLQDPVSGRPSPFLVSYPTAKKVIEVVRQLDKRFGHGETGAGPPPIAPLPPSVRVLVQNNSGSDRAMFDVLALTGILGGIGDNDGGPDYARYPVFTGQTPAAITDAFCILDGPAPYIDGGLSPLVPAVIIGVIPVDVNVTDAGHGYATPTAADNTKLTSATSGPARILYKPGGTGTLRCVVKLDESAAGGGVSFTHDVEFLPSSYTITADNVWEPTGLILTLPAAGTYLIFGSVGVYGQVSVVGTPYPGILVRVHDGTGILPATNKTGIRVFTTGTLYFGSVSFTACYDAAGGEDLEVQANRAIGGGTWTTSTVGLAGGSNDGGCLGYLKLG